MQQQQQDDPFAWMTSSSSAPPAQPARAPPQYSSSYSPYAMPPPPQQQQQQPLQQQQQQGGWGSTSASSPYAPPPQQWGQQQPQQQQWNWNQQQPPPAAAASTPFPPPAASPSSWANTNDPWATTTPAATSQWNNNTSFNNNSQLNNSSWGLDPFAVPSSSNNSFFSGQSSSSKLNTTTTNPFDVGNDDAGFFAAASSSTMKSGPAPPPPASDYAPPNAKTQRLLRVASMLFERGAIIRADKIYLQDLLLKQDKRAEQALDLAENDGNTDAINRLLYNERSSGVEDDDNSVQRAREAMKKRPSTAATPNRGRANSDDDDEQTEALPVATYSANEAPHPAAGGYSAPIPATMSLDQAKHLFTGQILVRVSSKMMFRKWKPCFFCIDRVRVVLFEDKSQWLHGTAQPRLVIPLHECMWIAKPSVKKTYSLIDDGRRVYFSTVKENAPQVLYAATASGMAKPTAYSPAIESRIVAKFASHYPDEISSFAHAVYSVVLLKQREAKAAAGGASGASKVNRQSSGYGNRGY